MSPDYITHRRRVPAKVIKAALKKAGYPRIVDFALSIGKCQSAVSMVISGDMKSAYIAGCIAKVMGRTPAEIWPRLYPDKDVPG
jgi:lambda repressor-like predicted transcriptional regulator